MPSPGNVRHTEALLLDSPVRSSPPGTCIIELCKMFTDLLGKLYELDKAPLCKTCSAAKRRESFREATLLRSYEILEIILATECSEIAEMQARAEAFRVWIKGFHPTFSSLDELAKDDDPDWCDRFAAAMSRDLIALHARGQATRRESSLDFGPRLAHPRRSSPGRSGQKIGP